MNRLTRFAIEDVQPPVLVGLSERFDRLPVDLHVEQDRLHAVVVIPDVVMDELVVPLQLPRIKG